MPATTASALHVHAVSGARFGVASRAVRVWLPPGYADDRTRRYPVLYLMDGQNVFDPATAFAGVAWSAGATAARLIAQRRIEPLILVGVDNAGAQRTDDFTPVPWRGRGGGADAFGRLLTEAIKPWIDAHYRTRPERTATGLAGASLGGLFALAVALARPDVFGRVAALSPTLWWADGALLRAIAGLRTRPDVRLWLDVGRREAPALRQHVRAAQELLLAKGWQLHRNAHRATLRHAEVARGRHDEASWGRRFDRVLRFLFPPPPRRRDQRGSTPPSAGTTASSATASRSRRSKPRAVAGTATS
ncbi:MAG: alpha/beta hydrolase [Planctomycetes bacterium]|nr:alpha/beta hydrolase [Planctomycetota bacterium]